MAISLTRRAVKGSPLTFADGDSNWTAIESAVDSIESSIAGKENAGAASAAISAHVADTDPHTQYLTEAGASSTYATVSALSAHSGNTSNPHSVTKAQVGLGNVDNTSDVSKPVSTAQAAADAAVLASAIQRANHTGTQAISTVTGLQAALDAKAALASPALTGTPTAPTAAVDTNTTQIATTAFAKKEADDAEAAAEAYSIQRSNHTGSQAISTVTGLQAALDGRDDVVAAVTRAQKRALAEMAVGSATGIGRRALMMSFGQGGYSDINIDGTADGGAIESIASAVWGSSTGSWQVNESGALVSRAANTPPYAYDYTAGVSGLRSQLAATNLILNSAAPATQGVAVTAQAYTLHFVGTGSVTLSGAYSGTLNGGGAGETKRVYLTFTPTAGTLTLTVSGSVTMAQLEAGSIATSYIPTTGSTASRAADVCSIPLSMTSAGWALIGGFIAPPQGALCRMLTVYIDDSNYYILHVGSTGTVSASGAHGGSNIGTASTASSVVAGEHYRVAAAWDAVNGIVGIRMRSRSGTLLTGQASLTQTLTAKAAAKLYVGHWASGGQPRTLITSAAVMPRSIPASMLAEYVP